MYVLRTIEASKIILSFNFDLLYTTGDFVCDTVPACIYKLINPKAKWVANIFHLNPSPFAGRKNNVFLSLGSWLFQRLSFIFLKKAETIFLLNQDVKKALLKQKFLPDRVFVLGAGIDLQNMGKIKDQRFKENKIIYLGRLNNTKGIYDLPEILARVAESVSPVRLEIIGSGGRATVEKLKSEFRKKDILELVTFHGFVKEKIDVYGILKSAKVFVLPSYEEGWSIAVFEAIACGLAPVTYDLPVFREIFGSELITVKSGEKKQFANKAAELLVDDKERRKYVNNLFNIVKNYSWEKISAREFNLIEE